MHRKDASASCQKGKFQRGDYLVLAYVKSVARNQSDTQWLCHMKEQWEPGQGLSTSPQWPEAPLSLPSHFVAGLGGAKRRACHHWDLDRAMLFVGDQVQLLLQRFASSFQSLQLGLNAIQP